MEKNKNHLTVTCPACGYPCKIKIKSPDLQHGKNLKCPMCGYEFQKLQISEPHNFDQRKI
ncbi:MAG: hypothetical protein R6U96_06850 [Promethearchaeia archaeon]